MARARASLSRWARPQAEGEGDGQHDNVAVQPRQVLDQPRYEEAGERGRHDDTRSSQFGEPGVEPRPL